MWLKDVLSGEKGPVALGPVDVKRALIYSQTFMAVCHEAGQPGSEQVAEGSEHPPVVSGGDRHLEGVRLGGVQ